MKKAILLAMCLVLIGASAAMAIVYTDVNDTIALTQDGVKWNNLNYIGDSDVFLTTKATFDTASGLFVITTNWNPGKEPDLGATTAMLFISTTGGTNWDYAINLDYKNTAQNQATVYKPTLVYKSTDVYYNANIYGKYYNVPDVNHLIPVVATAALDDTDLVWVTWSSITGTDTGNTVTVDLSNILGSGPWSFIWGTATCGNGVFTNGFDVGVPLPPSALLLGSGLLGLVGLGWRRRKTSV
jgi:hypothetical protein